MQILIKDKKILIIGLGMMGGSFAQGLSRIGFEVGALARRQESIDYALSHGFIAHGEAQVREEYVRQFDLVISGLYPGAFVEWIEKYQGFLKEGAVISDMTGVKRAIVGKIQGMLREDLEFIPAHPMAGREVSGVENSDCGVFRGANFIITPTERNTPEAIDLMHDIAVLLGFGHIATLTPEAHDEMIGFLSQLTHCIAVALMTCSDNRHLVDYTGDSFRDLTRIANINDAMWSELFLLNREVLLHDIDVFMREMNDLRALLEKGDREGLREKMRLSTERRKYFNK